MLRMRTSSFWVCSLKETLPGRQFGDICETEDEFELPIVDELVTEEFRELPNGEIPPVTPNPLYAEIRIP